MEVVNDPRLEYFSLLFAVGWSPVGVAANTSAEQDLTVTGVKLGDVISVNKPTAQAGLGVVGARVSAADTVSVTFGNFTAATPITPTASETYSFLVVRAK